MGLVELFEFKVGEVVNERKKLEKIVEQIKKQCRALGGRIEEAKISETSEILVCRFPEPKGITGVDFEEVEEEGGKLYIESEEGYHGVKVDVGNVRARIEVTGITGDAVYDNAGYVVPPRKTVRHFAVLPKRKGRGKRRVVKKTKEIIYNVSPDIVYVQI